jgi:Zn finger protein HypA/HybF involved in hydrogenase expression
MKDCLEIMMMMNDETYKCLDCGSLIDGYNNLHHYSEDSGGFCPACMSDNVELLTGEEDEEC